MIDKKININHEIKNCIPIVKETFIKYYGEEYRQIIEDKFDNSTYIGYHLPENIENLINQLFKEKTTELITEFLKENNLEPTEEEKKKYFGNYFSSLIDYKACNLNKIFDYLSKEEPPLYLEKGYISILQEIYNNPNLEKNTNEYKEAIDRIQRLKPSYDKMLEKFSRIKEEYHPYTNYVETCQKLKRNIYKKYEKQYFKEIFTYLSEHDKKMIIDNMNTMFFPYDKLECNGILFNRKYSFKSVLDSFDRQSNEILKFKASSASWKIQSIYRDRIAYFKKKGIDLGEDYEAYKNDKRCQELTPSIEFVEKIQNIRKRLNEEEKKEYVTSTTLYQEQLKEIENLNLLDKNFGYTYNNLLAGITCINPNIKIEESNPKLHCLLFFGLNRVNDYFDVNFIHECNHIVETELLNVEGENYRIRSGWELLEEKINMPPEQELKHRNKREFEMLNEITNELIAQEITEQMHQDGIYLFDRKETSKIKGKNTYERTRFLIQDFFNEYKQDIIQSRLTGNMEILFQKIGKDNFMELNKIISDYSNYFSGPNIYILKDSLRGNEKNDLTNYYYECIKRRDKVLSDIKNYSQQETYQR